MKTTLLNNTNLIAACGLYCANCGKLKNEKCPGCRENTKASWCKIRSCCFEKDIANCSACDEYLNPLECSKYNNLISKVIEYFTSTDRSLCIGFIREYGEEKFAAMMAEEKRVNLPKKRKK